jgi:prepilin-type N-terminal cleavage/methylation domain-containing protein
MKHDPKNENRDSGMIPCDGIPILTMKKSFTARGFSLIELIIAVTIMVILAGVGIALINPGAQLANSRNNVRKLNLQELMNYIEQYRADQGTTVFVCAAGVLPTSSAQMTNATGAGKYDIAQCIMPVYTHVLPFDPSASSSYFTSNADYNTGYTIKQNASGSITIAAPYAELGRVISITR